MKTNLEEQKKAEQFTETESYVFKNPISEYAPESQLGIESISLDDDYTRIDFVYIAPRYYLNGG